LPKIAQHALFLKKLYIPSLLEICRRCLVIHIKPLKLPPAEIDQPVKP
jgi:hypothetical protein